jgi:hypothetical protein
LSCKLPFPSLINCKKVVEYYFVMAPILEVRSDRWSSLLFRSLERIFKIFVESHGQWITAVTSVERLTSWSDLDSRREFFMDLLKMEHHNVWRKVTHKTSRSR